jgi:hypothetical protein
MPDTQEQNTPHAIWVISDVAPDGTYIATVQISDDIAIALDHAAGVRYATTVLAVAARAQFDAAAYAQMTKGATVEPATAKHTIADLRGDRPSLDAAATAPFDLRPGVNAAGEPFIGLWLPGKQLGQWSVADARQHAVDVLEVLEGAALDDAYYQLLLTTGLAERKARYMVADLANWRHQEPDPTRPGSTS